MQIEELQMQKQDGRQTTELRLNSWKSSLIPDFATRLTTNEQHIKSAMETKVVK